MTIESVMTIFGRALLALLFLFARLAKAFGPEPFLSRMAAFNVPGLLLPAVITLEVGAGLALLFGWKMRYAAGALVRFAS
jgi:putative oxidoreductase